MRHKLNRSERLILRSIIEAPVAWQTVDQLADLAKLSLDETNDALASLDLDGWVAVWEPDGQLAVTLTSLGAERLKVELTEAGTSGNQRWLGREQAARLPFRTRGAVGGDAEFDLLDIVPDKSPPPDIAAELSERYPEEAEVEGEPATKVNVHFLPRPTILLGLGMTPWPRATEVGKHRSCPVCQSKPIPPKAYCLWCDRWGMDAHLYRRSRNPGPDGVYGPSSPPRRTRPDQAHLARESRKQRRKKKHDERWGTRKSGAKPSHAPVG